jgi:hypothetical protein
MKDADAQTPFELSRQK